MIIKKHIPFFIAITLLIILSIYMVQSGVSNGDDVQIYSSAINAGGGQVDGDGISVLYTIGDPTNGIESSDGDSICLPGYLQASGAEPFTPKPIIWMLY